MKYVMILFIRLYQKFISPIKRPCCRFTPTCSAYALEAFTKRGFFIGLILTVWRILRCNPFSRGGYDPVPEKGFRNPVDKETENDIGSPTKKENEEI
ncbi:MAG: membrane protein insertion efficiency factor YidD [Clostridia bacterium]|nr:membrane protein insertion efficiency factor YidD [Clostridia bacterium]